MNSITHGRNYTWWVNFVQRGNPPVDLVTRVRHTANIATWVDGGYACDHTQANCYFNVDQVNLAGDMHIAPGGPVTPPPVTPPSNPGAPVLVNVQTNEVSLSWSASSAGSGGAAVVYEVERCVGWGCTAFTQIGVSSTNSYVDANVAAGTTYSYRVRARNTNGALSSYSAVTTATTPAAPGGGPPPPDPCNLTCDVGYMLCGDYYNCNLFCYSYDWLPPDPACPAR
jgi:hypothetical protein